MRIGIMAQSVNETMGGIGVYSQEIVRALLRVDNVNEYILMYPGFGAARMLRGQFHQHANATEIETESGRPLGSWVRFEQGPRALKKMRALVPGRNLLGSGCRPRVAEQYGVDVLFNPHLTVPVRGRFGKVTVIHNMEYHTVPNVYNWRMYCWWYMLEKRILPAADRLISIANIITGAMREHLKYPMTQVRMIYHGVSDKFGARQTTTGWSAPVKSTVCPSTSFCSSAVLSPKEFRNARTSLCSPQRHDSAPTGRGWSTAL